MLKDARRFLVDERHAGRLALLVIDEAQNLSLPALEEIRMLSNLETEKSKLMQIILVGQPDLRDKLARPELEQLRQRITVSYHLEAARRRRDRRTTSTTGWRARDRHAARVPARRDRPDSRRSGGVPRMINVIADATLLFGYGEERSDIDKALDRGGYRRARRHRRPRPALEPEPPRAVVPTDGRRPTRARFAGTGDPRPSAERRAPSGRSDRPRTKKLGRELAELEQKLEEARARHRAAASASSPRSGACSPTVPPAEGQPHRQPQRRRAARRAVAAGAARDDGRRVGPHGASPARTPPAFVRRNQTPLQPVAARQEHAARHAGAGAGGFV